MARLNLGGALFGAQDALLKKQQQDEIAKRQQASQEATAGRADDAQHAAIVKMILDKALGSTEDAARISSAGIMPPGYEGLNPTAQARNSFLSKDIEASKQPEDVPTEEGIRGQYRGPQDNPSNLFGLHGQPVSTGGGPTKTIQDLMAERAAKLKVLQAATDEKGLIPVKQKNPDGSETETYMTKAQAAAKGAIPIGLSAGQTGENKQTELLHGELSGPVTKAKAGQAGAEAGAREAASYPWQMKLAQTKADMNLVHQQELDEYKAAHPHATAQELNRASTARVALGTIAEDRVMLDEMEKRGMTGAIRGRGADIAASRIKAEDLFKNPDDARLAADFFSKMRLTKSIAAVAHGGARGGGSPQMDAIFDKIINGVGDANLTRGQLDAVQSIMEKYAKNPSQEQDLTNLNIPGLKSTADSKWDSLAVPQAPIAPIPAHKVGG